MLDRLEEIRDERGLHDLDLNGRGQFMATEKMAFVGIFGASFLGRQTL
ncbi:hypothetical protein [Mesorhizobium sp.]|nr:hypothetical protein [Mesorhizobium sp.]